MRIATYNIWNASAGMPHRFEQIVEQIAAVNADILCLQEVADAAQHAALEARLPAAQGVFCAHRGSAEGLSVFSRYPLELLCDGNDAQVVRCRMGEKTAVLANVHLPWENALYRERAILKITDAVCREQGDMKLLLGDFNCSDRSGVHQYLLGQSSLLGKAAVPCWFDLAESMADLQDHPPECTVDFRQNPRWQGANTIECCQRFDRIYLQNPYPQPFPVLRSCGIFGRKVSDLTHLAASDHYGVYADLD